MNLRTRLDRLESQMAPTTNKEGDCGNAECNWRGPLSACSYVGAIGPCCPECREIVEPDAARVALMEAGRYDA